MFATRSEKRPYYLSFWMFVWGEIASKSLKNPLEIVIKICSIFRQIFLWFWVDFGPSGRPLGVAGDGQRTVFFLSGIALEPKMAPRPRPRASGTPPNLKFLWFLQYIWSNSVTIFHYSLVSARWREGRRQLDIYVWIYIYIYIWQSEI
jgi:hypothetical protein